MYACSCATEVLHACWLASGLVQLQSVYQVARVVVIHCPIKSNHCAYFAISSHADNGCGQPIEGTPHVPNWMSNIQKPENNTAISSGQCKCLAPCVGASGPRREAPLEEFIVVKSKRTKRVERKVCFDAWSAENETHTFSNGKVKGTQDPRRG